MWLDIFIGCFGLSVLSLIMFILGMNYMKNIIHEEREKTQYEEMRHEWYRFAGVQHPGDPVPYVPPKKYKYRTPRGRMLPGMDALNRLMREGKRGTVMWRAGDRNKNVG